MGHLTYVAAVGVGHFGGGLGAADGGDRAVFWLVDFVVVVYDLQLGPSRVARETRNAYHLKPPNLLFHLLPATVAVRMHILPCLAYSKGLRHTGRCGRLNTTTVFRDTRKSRKRGAYRRCVRRGHRVSHIPCVVALPLWGCGGAASAAWGADRGRRWCVGRVRRMV